MRSRRRYLAAAVVGVLAGLAAWPLWQARRAEPRRALQAPTSAAAEPAAAPRLGGSTPTPAALPPACAQLSLRRKAALVLVVGMPDVTDPGDPLVTELRDLGVGGVFLTGYNASSAAQVRELVAALRAGRSPRPLIATDEEWGRVSSFRALLGATSSPRTLAAQGSAAQLRRDARDLGEALGALGVDWNFAPVADLDDGPSDGVIGDRAFSGDPMVAADYAGAFADGLRAAGVLATVKHFPGHGAVPGDIDPHSDSVVSPLSRRQLRTHLQPFATLIADDVPAVMLNHVTYAALDDDLPASMSPAAYQLLRAQGFDGVAITDSIGMGAVHRRWDFPQAAERALRAGADAVLATDGTQARAMRDQLVRAVRAGRLSEPRLDQAVTRVLRLHAADPDAHCGR